MMSAAFSSHPARNLASSFSSSSSTGGGSYVSSNKVNNCIIRSYSPNGFLLLGFSSRYGFLLLGVSSQYVLFSSRIYGESLGSLGFTFAARSSLSSIFLTDAFIRWFCSLRPSSHTVSPFLNEDFRTSFVTCFLTVGNAGILTFPSTIISFAGISSTIPCLFMYGIPSMISYWSIFATSKYTVDSFCSHFRTVIHFRLASDTSQLQCCWILQHVEWDFSYSREIVAHRLDCTTSVEQRVSLYTVDLHICS